MGWADCGEDDLGRPIGYSYEEGVTCDFKGCDAEINRGLDHACGGMHGEGEDAGIQGEPCCERYFCGNHSYPLHHNCPHLSAYQEWEMEAEIRDSVKELVRILEEDPRDSSLFSVAYAAGSKLIKARDARNDADALHRFKTTEVGKLEYRRGFSDANAGHGPSLLGGPYMLGYIDGKSGRDMRADA